MMTDRVVLITGASSGIGLEASVTLAARGAQVVMVARDRSRGDAAVEDAKARSGRHDISLLVCDMSSMPEVRALAREVHGRHTRLDVLVNNAGSVKATRQTTDEGGEWTFAANYLGHFLLTNLLLDLLRGSAPARIVNVSSEAHRRATIDFDNLQFEHGGYSLLNAYGRSKLAQVLFTTELARRLEGTGVTVNALHPGAVATAIWTRAQLPWYLRAPIALAKLIMLSPSQAADRVAHLATSSELEGQTGGYYVKNRLVAASSTARDQALARRLWDESARLTNLTPSG